MKVGAAQTKRAEAIDAAAAEAERLLTETIYPAIGKQAEAGGSALQLHGQMCATIAIQEAISRALQANGYTVTSADGSEDYKPGVFATVSW